LRDRVKRPFRRCGHADNVENIRITPEHNPFLFAEAAGLTYVNDAQPGITRERHGDRWMYRRPNGSEVQDPDAPAWYGVTPLHHDHVRVQGETLMFEFRAKSGKEQQLRLQDHLLASVVYACEELP